MVMRLVTRLRDRLQPFLFGDVLGDHLAHVFKMVAPRIEHPEARQRPRHEMVMQCLIAAQRSQRQFPSPKARKNGCRFVCQSSRIANIRSVMGRPSLRAIATTSRNETASGSIMAEASTSPH